VQPPDLETGAFNQIESTKRTPKKQKQSSFKFKDFSVLKKKEALNGFSIQRISRAQLNKFLDV